ncbi:hypothetical protein [Pseudoroseomonas sp. WGS1072]|uniref:hypothetical protein n=1 Tax=Roseomonas sp. WGS1072 TaxID=3366816 RepID=UPI003BF2C200
MATRADSTLAPTRRRQPARGVHSEHSLLVLAERVVLNRSGSKPFRAAPAQKPYRPGFLRRSLAYIANGDRPPPLLRFGSAPSCNVLGNQRQGAVSSQRADTALRASLAACCIIFAACAGWAVTL